MSRGNITNPARGELTPELQRTARMLRALLQALIGVSLLIFIAALVTTNPWAGAAVAGLLLGVELGAWLLLRGGYIRLAAWALIGGLWLVLGMAAFAGPSQGNAAFVSLVLVTAGAGLLLGGPPAFLIAGLNGLIGIGYVAAAANQLLPAPWLSFTLEGWFVFLVLLFFAMAGLTSLVNFSVKDALASAQASADAQVATVREMENIRADLENQVIERTRDLERRTRYLQAATEVSRAAAVILDPQSLMQTAVDLILEKFDLYYTGVFLTEPGGEWALLQAGTGAAGQGMVARGHRMRVGSGMVGWSIANAQPRIALDVGRDAVRLSTAELPETRSEAAIPLRSRGKVLGALTVQSRQPAAFGEVEIAIFQSLADQLAIALDNARLLSESSQALQQAQRAYRQVSGRAWRDFLHTSTARRIQYRYGQIDVQTEAQTDNGGSAAEDLLAQTRRQAVDYRRPAQCVHDGRATLFLPLQVRDQIVGVIQFVKEPDESQDGWTVDEIELLETISAQLGAALDSARLYQDTQRAAAREQVTGEATAHIRQTLDMQTVLRTAVEEIQRHLSLPEVTITLSAPDEPVEKVDN